MLAPPCSHTGDTAHLLGTGCTQMYYPGGAVGCILRPRVATSGQACGKLES